VATIRPDLTAAHAAFTAPPVTRFAPSPTGYLHLGHVVNAIYTWGVARAMGGRVLLRVEDHDRIRSRPEFVAAFLNKSATQFVAQLNTNAGNVLSAAEQTNLITILGATPADSTKRAQVLRAVAEDQTLRDAEFNKAFVLMQYFGYLRRGPNEAPDADYSGYNFWLTKLNDFGGNFVNAEMVKAFIISPEYRHRFGP